MKFKIGDIAYFYHISNNVYSWILKNYQKVKIYDRGFDEFGVVYYSVRISENEISSWYNEDDLLSEQEIRKYKILNINGKNTD